MIGKIEQSHQNETVVEAEVEEMAAGEAVVIVVETVDTDPLNARLNSLNKL